MQQSPITLIFIVVNVAFSLYAFNDPQVFDRFKFHVGAILRGREWHRIITSAFLHVNLTHLLVNMLSLYFCGPAVEEIFGMYAIMNNGGPLPFIILYFLSMIGGGLLSLLIHRTKTNYSAVGASGAISGIIFALALLMPDGIVYLFMLVPCPLWLFAILYVAYSLFGMRSSLHNIGHAAHLGGALLGLLVTAAFFPQMALKHWIFLLILTVPTALALFIIARDPVNVDDPALQFRRFFKRISTPKPKPFQTPAPVKRQGLEFNDKAERQKELDRLLEKVASKGLQSLSPEERRRLDELSR